MGLSHIQFTVQNKKISSEIIRPLFSGQGGLFVHFFRKPRLEPEV
ncbi:MAG: hypothetical protein OP8BY_1781 [Candidatus Saccharicenans subterraneus]|uniref:Uncharacterized protein n=1 Tax=Candidatus Saccharicenans subterraneus TaxID=2508984 RepID=A0A3E2BNG9_9BACT|nr:MAG: hypothetical protein OP8BY_1781 [Candidatus Saccharicenans subterraneum]